MRYASEIEEVTAISTGLPQLDLITGVGGIPRKRITEISGTWSVGKTTLALQTVVSAQKQGIECLWLDAEYSWDSLYAKKLGVDTEKLGFIREETAEESLDILLEYLSENKDCLAVIDAVGALKNREETEKKMADRTIGGQASLVSRFCRKVIPILDVNNHVLIVLNHEFVPLMNMGGRPSVQTSGGKKLEYHKSLWLRLQKTGTYLKQGDKRIGFMVEAEVRKNKLADTQYETCELSMYFGKGFSATDDLFARGLKAGIITKEGNTYLVNGQKLAVGARKAREAMNDPQINKLVSEGLI